MAQARRARKPRTVPARQPGTNIQDCQFSRPHLGQPRPTMAFAVLYGVITITWTLWFIAWLRGRRPKHGPLPGREGRASYAT